MHHQIIYVQWNYIWRLHHDRMEMKEVCTGQSVRIFLSIFVSTSLIMYSKPEQLISNPVSSTQCSTTTFFWWNLKHFSLNNFHSYYTGVWIQWHVVRRQRSPRVALSDIFNWIILLTERCLHVFQHWELLRSSLFLVETFLPGRRMTASELQEADNSQGSGDSQSIQDSQVLSPRF